MTTTEIAVKLNKNFLNFRSRFDSWQQVSRRLTVLAKERRQSWRKKDDSPGERKTTVLANIMVITNAFRGTLKLNQFLYFSIN